MKKTYLVLGGVLVALLVGFYFLSKPQNKESLERAVGVEDEASNDTVVSNSMPVPGSGDVMEKEVMMDDTNATQIDVSAFEMGYKVSASTLKAGDTVTIKLTNTGNMPHDFVIDSLNVKSKLVKSGESTEVTFKVPASGELVYYCSVGNHRKLGMEGKFTVTNQ